MNHYCNEIRDYLTRKAKIIYLDCVESECDYHSYPDGDGICLRGGVLFEDANTGIIVFVPGILIESNLQNGGV